MKDKEKQDYHKNMRGFTLIEIIVVIIIIALIATLIGPNIFKRLSQGKQKAAKVQIEMLGQALDSYRLDIGTYPTTSEGLNALITNPGVEQWDGPYLKKTVLPKDPWNRDYQYQSPGSNSEYDLFSYGADGTPGGDGENKDITSWE